MLARNQNWAKACPWMGLLTLGLLLLYSSAHEPVFWALINILLVWVAFAFFGLLVFVSIGFGLLIIIFSVMNCLLHIIQGIKLRRWNPGLVVASFQFLISVYAGYFITAHGLDHPIPWWMCGILFSVIVHALLFKCIMKDKPETIAAAS